MKYLLIGFLIIQGFGVFSQTFQSVDTLLLNAPEVSGGQWADIDNDGVLDYVALLKIIDSTEVGFFSIKNDLLGYKRLFAVECSEAKMQIADFTRDGLLDILMSMKDSSLNRTDIYANNNSQDFKPVARLDHSYSYNTLLADFNRDGTKEVLVFTEDSLFRRKPKIYAYKKDDKVWEVLEANLSDHITYHKLLNIDIDNDSWEDLLVTGIDTANNFVVEFYKNNQGKLEKTINSFEYVDLLEISKADLDEDGDFDVVFYGGGGNGSALYYYENNNGTFTKRDFGITLPDSVIQFFSADFNSDGLSDFMLKSRYSNGDLKAELLIKDNNNNYFPEQLGWSAHQEFGGMDGDGDLDVIQFNSVNNSIAITLLKNITTVNNFGPDSLVRALVFPQIRNVSFSWEPVLDDHTASTAVTYDLFISKDEVEVSSGFQINGLNRVVVDHGNQSTLTDISYYDFKPGIYSYGVGTVDNSFCGNIIPGSGSGVVRGYFVLCDTILANRESFCRPESVSLVASHGKKGTWYSTTKGYLGYFDTLKVEVTGNEEIYFSIQGSLDCADQEAWFLDVTEINGVEELPDTTGCVGQVLTFEIEDSWKSILWTSLTKGELSETNKLSYTVEENDTIVLLVESQNGCLFRDTFLINASEVDVVLGGATYKIYKGKSVGLLASGGVNYEWTPADYLNNNLIANPVASPHKTMDYKVKVTNSWGCVGYGVVKIIVENEAFIPNLFTPNKDGKNDVLKIYGLDSGNGFIFKIYNRSGSLVYSSNDIQEVVSVGWDGSINGQNQPNGVYYWEVHGSYENGGTIYLNGKSSGAVHLLR